MSSPLHLNSYIVTGDALAEYAKTINTKQDFEYFLKCLVRDYEQNQHEWQNQDLSSYLIGLSDFVPAMSGYYKNELEDIDVEKITWRVAADMLLAASVYE